MCVCVCVCGVPVLPTGIFCSKKKLNMSGTFEFRSALKKIELF